MAKTVTIKPSGGDYASLSAAITGEVAANANLISAGIDVLNFECYAMSDTTAVNVNGFTTDATHIIHIYCAAGEGHAGVWDDSKYKVQAANANLFQINDNYVVVTGLQIYDTQTSPDATTLIIGNDVTNWKVDACLIRGVRGSGASTTAVANTSSGWGDNGFLINNIVFGHDAGLFMNFASSSSTIFDCHNNTFYDMGVDGINMNSTTSANVSMRNNIVNNCGTACYQNLNANAVHSNNISDDTTSPDAAFQSLSPTFVDDTTPPYNLHLDAADTAARGQGANLSSLFTDDVDGDTRSAWDIGADEYISPATAAVTGTATASIDESDIVTGGKTIIITLTGDTWVN